MCGVLTTRTPLARDYHFRDYVIFRLRKFVNNDNKYGDNNKMVELQKIMLGLLTNYISMSMHVAQKQILTSRNPQQWMIDKSFNGLFNNVPTHYNNAVNPSAPQVDMLSIFQQFANMAPQQGQPAQPANIPAVSPTVTP